MEAFRQGKRPSVEEFARRYPEHADEIREMLPALVLMEKAKSGDDGPGNGVRPRARPPRALRQLGDYQILREVGRGGMGVVYEAQQLSLGRHVAIKVLPAHALLDPRHLGRFQREARSAARLHHTNIVPVFGVGEQDGLHYYVMQFIQGLGLDVVLDELQPPAAAARQPGTDPRRSRRPSDQRRVETSPRSTWPAVCSRGSSASPSRSVRSRSRQERHEHRIAAELKDAEESALGPSRRPSRRRRTIHLPGQSGDVHAERIGQAVLAERGPRRHAGGRRPGSCRQPGSAAPRHQAVQPAAGRHGQRLGRPTSAWPRRPATATT